MASSSKYVTKKKVCCAIGCQNHQGMPDISFFCAQRSDKEQSFAWAKAINRANEDGSLWMPRHFDRICSAHFVSGKFSTDRLSPDYRPTIFETNHIKPMSESAQQRYQRMTEKAEATGPINIRHMAHNDKTTMTDPPKPTYHRITLQILSNDVKCKAMTGISKHLFEVQYELLLKRKAFLKMNSLQDRDQLAVFLVKLKTGNTFEQIGVMFDVFDLTISKVFKHVLEKMYSIAQNYVWWYSREEVDYFMPESFKKYYPKTRVILDASEIKIECPGKVDRAVLCYSNYKSSHTLKFLIGVSPNGQITFISKCYGGRITDCQLTQESGVVDLLENDDEMMCDRVNL